MPIKPQPFTLKCQKCGKTKKVSPKSDAMDIRDLIQKCSSCDVLMKRVKDL